MLPAATEEDKKVVPAVHRDDLSLYTTPQEASRRVETETEAGRLESGVAALRTSLEPYAARCPRLQRVTGLGGDAWALLSQPPEGFYPRAGIIGVAGALGLLLARGSRIKKLVYPAGLMAVGATLYYPEQAVAVGRSTGETAYDWALRGYVALDRMVRPGKEEEESSPSDTKA
ncbi:hypothetical protein CRUP_036688 [Coryphaenoides rupestris]|nr:hypothetical protein CRUP_036688 [Coryphaenoides rupestris]